MAKTDEQQAALSRELVATLDEFRQLTQLSNAETNVQSGDGWVVGIKQVAQGDAFLTVMGNWVWADAAAADRPHLRQAAFPGSKGAFAYTPDGFVVSRLMDTDGAAPHLWLHGVVEDEQAQLNFSREKHSIPAISGLAEAKLDLLEDDALKQTYLDFQSCRDQPDSCRLLLAVSGLGPPVGTDLCYDEVGAWLAVAAGFDPELAQGDIDEDACERIAFPTNEADAEAALLDVLLGIARAPFAADCRN
jgi:hypothetical protein